ncbi:MAG: hypothetical protein ACFE0Q_07080 [Anaerolineae bacterium]
MQPIEILVRDEQNKDLHRRAENERLIRQAQPPRSLLKNVRHVLGNGLVQVGQQLLNER